MALATGEAGNTLHLDILLSIAHDTRRTLLHCLELQVIKWMSTMGTQADYLAFKV